MRISLPLFQFILQCLLDDEYGSGSFVPTVPPSCAFADKRTKYDNKFISQVFRFDYDLRDKPLYFSFRNGSEVRSCGDRAFSIPSSIEVFEVINNIGHSLYKIHFKDFIKLLGVDLECDYSEDQSAYIKAAEFIIKQLKDGNVL